MKTQGTHPTHTPPTRRDAPPFRLRFEPFPPSWECRGRTGREIPGRVGGENDFLIINQRPDLGEQGTL
jgi:hypothetical protein